MNDYESMQRADVRLRVLQVLASVPGYQAHDGLVRSQLSARFAHALSQDALRSELAWLNEQGLVKYQQTGDVVLSLLTQRGHDCSAGVAQIPGVARPGPGEMLIAAGIGLLGRL